MNNEIMFSDLANICMPSENISEKRQNNMWTSYYYETAHFSGTMLISPAYGRPRDVLLKPALKGWYKIYIGLYAENYNTSEIVLKLSKDIGFSRIGSCVQRNFAEHYVEDVFWKCAKMDGEDIIIGKHLSEEYEKTAAIAWIRFVEMTEEEICNYLEESKRVDTKRIYATNDMHGMFCFYDMKNKQIQNSIVQDYADSDVEWLAVEDLIQNDGKVNDTKLEDFSFTSPLDKSFAKSFDVNTYHKTLKDIVQCGKKLGLKMCVSKRIAEWGMEFPSDKVYFENEFAKNHFEYSCIDRDGDITNYMSFMYDEVQDYLIDAFIKMAETDADAVQLLFSRGWPFILFEKPFADKFFEKYGEDARLLPLDDERIIELKCEIITDFIRKLRNSLDEAGYAKTEIHAKVLFSVYDSKLVGLDVETWARERLVNRIVSDERRIREVLSEEIFEVDGVRINLERYKKYARESLLPAIRYDYDRIFEPMEDSKGILKGPKDQQERISEFMELENKYGITVYIEIMPRNLSQERIKQKALEIYASGCNHIGLWDTYSRVIRKAEWNMWKKIGHKDELEGFSAESDFKMVRIIKIGDKNVRDYKPSWGG